MKIHYYPETDSLYVELSTQPGAETREISPDVRVDFDAEGNLVGFDIDHASQRMDLASIEARGVPGIRVVGTASSEIGNI